MRSIRRAGFAFVAFSTLLLVACNGTGGSGGGSSKPGRPDGVGSVDSLSVAEMPQGTGGGNPLSAALMEILKKLGLGPNEVGLESPLVTMRIIDAACGAIVRCSPENLGFKSANELMNECRVNFLGLQHVSEKIGLPAGYQRYYNQSVDYENNCKNRGGIRIMVNPEGAASCVMEKSNLDCTDRQ